MVDIGVGDDPNTTVALARVLLPGSSLFGTEVDAPRLALSLSLLPSLHPPSSASLVPVALLLGSPDFSPPLPPPSLPRFLRAVNVLRDYDVEAALEAARKMAGQVERGGIFAEGSVEARGRVAVAMVLRRRTVGEEGVDGGTGSDSDNEADLPVSAVIFAADLPSLSRDPDYAPASPASWFNRHNHLPRIWRGYCDGAECEEGEEPAWATPVKDFLEEWRREGEEVEGGGGEGEESLEERFVKSAEGVKERVEGKGKGGAVVADWARRGVVVWLPGEGELGVPHVDEWRCFRERGGA